MAVGVNLALCASALYASGGSGPHPEAPSYSGALAISWNERVLAIAEAEDHFLTLKGIRTVAMMHLAMHDALHAVRPRYAPYDYVADARGADPIAAAAQ
ncbi:MAG: hypothetical protein K8H90_01130, partial [Thermoanaerobaculia bacterium]|nr:hypothetical protein [Thermoanaerobaculia bacterium]